MRTAVHSQRLGKQDLEKIAAKKSGSAIDDMEFLETLACKHCMVMPPWIYHVTKDGALEKLTPVRYSEDYSLDKATILLAVMERLHH